METHTAQHQFSSEAQNRKVTDEHTILPSPRKIAFLARVIASALAILIIGGPLIVLVSKNMEVSTKLYVVMAALITFPLAIQIAARPKHLELFVATATYCAVLTTFLAINTPFDIADVVEKLAASLREHKV